MLGNYFVKIDCSEFDRFNMAEFVKCNWSAVEVLDLQQCNID